MCAHAQLDGELLTVGQLGILLYIEHNQPVSSKRIVAELGITKGGVAQFLDGLDKLGLICREQDPDDRRIAYVSLSETGEAKARVVHERRRAFLVRVASVLDDEELRNMIAVHEKMTRRIAEIAYDETCGTSGGPG